MREPKVFQANATQLSFPSQSPSPLRLHLSIFISFVILLSPVLPLSHNFNIQPANVTTFFVIVILDMKSAFFKLYKSQLPVLFFTLRQKQDSIEKGLDLVKAFPRITVEFSLYIPSAISCFSSVSRSYTDWPCHFCALRKTVCG